MLCRLLSGARTTNHHLFFPLTLATPFHTENLADAPHGLHHSLSRIITRILLPCTLHLPHPHDLFSQLFHYSRHSKLAMHSFLILMCLSYLISENSLWIGPLPFRSLSLSWESTLTSLPTHLPHLALTFLFSLPPPLPPLPLPAEFAMIHSLLLTSLFILNPLQLPS